MKRNTKIITKDDLVSMINNCRYFGWPLHWKRADDNQFKVTAPSWVWSQFCI